MDPTEAIILYEVFEEAARYLWTASETRGHLPPPETADPLKRARYAAATLYLDLTEQSMDRDDKDAILSRLIEEAGPSAQRRAQGE